MTDELRIGVVGCGYWGIRHVRVLSGVAGVHVTAIDREPARRQTAIDAHQVPRVAAELDEVIDDLDALIIATPPTTHYPIADQAIEAGLHVLVEKPMTTELAEADDLIAKATARDLCLFAGHTFEFNAAVWGLADAIKDPGFGRVRYINSARLNLGLYQPDTDVLWDLAPHDVSIINYILGAQPTSVSAWGLKLMGDKSDVAYLSMRYDDLDVSANIHVSWLDPMKVRRTTVVGEHSMVVYDDVASEERLRIYDKGVKPTGEAGDRGSGVPLSYRYGDIVSPYIDFREPLQLEIGAFVDAIRAGTPEATNANRGRDVVAVLCAAEESQRTGGWVDVTLAEPLTHPVDAGRLSA
ncbi:MAG: Gfo/Idh/MocA family oxidoreductase [Actinomycetota bacterium]